jgi:uncharacterized protein
MTVKRDRIGDIALLLLIMGGLNWLLFAFNFNLIGYLFGRSVIAELIYLFIGLSAIYWIYPLYEMISGRSEYIHTK